MTYYSKLIPPLKFRFMSVTERKSRDTKKVHVVKDQTTNELTTWFVYCECCAMNDQAVVSWMYHHGKKRTVVRFRKHEDALAAAIRHYKKHQTREINYGRYMDGY